MSALLPAESMAFTVARGIAGRGDEIPPNIAVALLLTVERLANGASDLQLRIDRTLDYTDELLRGPLSADVAMVARAVHNSLCTTSVASVTA